MPADRSPPHGGILRKRRYPGTSVVAVREDEHRGAQRRKTADDESDRAVTLRNARRTRQSRQTLDAENSKDLKRGKPHVRDDRVGAEVLQRLQRVPPVLGDAEEREKSYEPKPTLRSRPALEPSYGQPQGGEKNPEPQHHILLDTAVLPEGRAPT